MLKFSEFERKVKIKWPQTQNIEQCRTGPAIPVQKIQSLGTSPDLFACVCLGCKNHPFFSFPQNSKHAKGLEIYWRRYVRQLLHHMKGRRWCFGTEKAQ